MPCFITFHLIFFVLVPTGSWNCINDIFAKDVFATSISKWSSTPGEDSTDLNEGQREAMTLAIMKCFQLIQGPPGEKSSLFNVVNRTKV